MKFIMMVGLQGSGKSTLAKKISEKENAIVLSSDEIRTELYGTLMDQSDHERVFSLMHKRTLDALKNGKSVIFDATNTSAKARRGIMKQIQRFDCEKEAIVVARPYKDCLAMNAQRKFAVPEKDIYKKYLSFQMPYYFEGFTNIRIEYPNPEDKEKYGDYCFAFNKYLDYDQNNPWHPETLGEHLLDVHSRMNLMGLTDDKVLFQTALIHDIGKPVTRKLNPETGYCSYYKHANIGAYMSMFYSGLEDPVKTAALITYHNDFVEFQKKPSLEEKFRKRVGEDFYKDAKILSIADHPDKEIRERMVEEFKPNTRDEAKKNISIERGDVAYER